VSALVFTLRDVPAQRLDLAPLVPQRLAGMSERDIARIELQTTRERVCAADVFKIAMGDAGRIVFEGGSERFDRIGCGMTEGEIQVQGDVGVHAARLMRGGTLAIDGNAGPWAASGMKGGVLKITGNAGDRLGGPLAGETTGMRGGIVVVGGNAGDRAADRLRRGMIIVEGTAGVHAGSRMIAGTLIVRGPAGPLPGYLMARGTLVLASGGETLSPTFADCGVHDFEANALMAAYIKPYSPALADVLRRPWRRLAGDMAVTGKGEIFYPPD
jgi:formylmethanofuran dehydrogenase subunit C